MTALTDYGQRSHVIIGVGYLYLTGCRVFALLALGRLPLRPRLVEQLELHGRDR